MLDREVLNIADLAIAPDKLSVAFAGEDRQTGEVGMFLGRLGTTEIHRIVPLKSHNGVPQETSIGWAFDGKAVLFSKDREVWSYDIDSQQTSLLFRLASNPTCSLDGKWIAFRDSDGYARIVSKEDGEIRRGSRWTITGQIHWSPDSAYYLVNENVPGSSPKKCPFNTCFVVYRVRDGSRLQLQGTTRKDSFFGWLRGSWFIE